MYDFHDDKRLSGAKSEGATGQTPRTLPVAPSATEGSMAEPVVITWSFANWLTVVLMVAIAFAGVGWAVRAYQARQAA